VRPPQAAAYAHPVRLTRTSKAFHMVGRARLRSLPSVVQDRSHQGAALRLQSASAGAPRTGSRAGLSRASSDGSRQALWAPSIGAVKCRLPKRSANAHQPNMRLKLTARVRPLFGARLGRRSLSAHR
jgi:hypothetical protein